MVTSLAASPDVVIVPFQDAPFSEALRLYRERGDQSWSLTDCSSFALMKRSEITAALTYDRHFEQAGFRALLRTEVAR